MKKVIGAFEKVNFPEFGLTDVIAKVDTGALSGAIHATEISQIKLSSGKEALEFFPYGRPPKVTITGFREKLVRSSNGAVSKRYVIPTIVVVQENEFPINISLADRSAMMKGVLIGRRFLRRHGFVVDPKKGTKYRYDVK